MTTKVTALQAQAIDLIHKTLTAPPLDVVIMTGVRLVLMGALRGLHMVGDSGAGRSKYDNEPPSYPRSSGENTSSYGSEEQTLSYERRP